MNDPKKRKAKREGVKKPKKKKKKDCSPYGNRHPQERGGREKSTETRSFKKGEKKEKMNHQEKKRQSPSQGLRIGRKKKKKKKGKTLKKEKKRRKTRTCPKREKRRPQHCKNLHAGKKEEKKGGKRRDILKGLGKGE